MLIHLYDFNYIAHVLLVLQKICKKEILFAIEIFISYLFFSASDY